MGCITTYSGEAFDPAQPDSQKIHIADIAHALSLLCRANGHFKRFYSVGQHCVNCALEAQARGYRPQVQLACLLHDASEAYLADITRPVKEHLAIYLELEARLQGAIYNKYLTGALSQAEWEWVQDIDNQMLLYEFQALMPKRVFSQEAQIHGNPQLEQLPFETVQNQYLALWRQLSGQGAKEAEA